MTPIYNRYFSLDPDTSSDKAYPADTANEANLPSSKTTQFEDLSSQEPRKEQKGLGGLRGLFGDNIKLPELDADTILLLVLVYFLVADGDNDHISDTLLIIGMLLLLGF